MNAEPMTEPELNEYDAETVRLVVAAEKVVNGAEAEYEDLKSAASNAKKAAEAETQRLRSLIREREEGRGKRPESTLLDMIPKDAQAWREIRIADLPIADGIKAQLSFEPITTAGELLDAISSFNPADGTPFGLAAGDVAEVRMKLAEMADREQQRAFLDVSAGFTPPVELWREYPIERWTRFGLTARDVEKMAEGGVKRETGRRPIVTVGDLSNFTIPTGSGYSRQYADIKGIGAAGADRISEAESKFWVWWQGGGDAEFASERGLMNGPAPVAGDGSGGSGGVGSGEALTDAFRKAADIEAEASGGDPAEPAKREAFDYSDSEDDPDRIGY